VTIKSPIPDNPIKDNCFAPKLTPNLVISANPRVISAALALSPKFKPSEIPAPNAIIFFNAPPSSTPITSSLVYTLKFSLKNKCWVSSAFFILLLATVTVVEVLNLLLLRDLVQTRQLYLHFLLL